MDGISVPWASDSPPPDICIPKIRLNNRQPTRMWRVRTIGNEIARSSSRFPGDRRNVAWLSGRVRSLEFGSGLRSCCVRGRGSRVAAAGAADRGDDPGADLVGGAAPRSVESADVASRGFTGDGPVNGDCCAGRTSGLGGCTLLLVTQRGKVRAESCGSDLLCTRRGYWAIRAA